MSDELYFAHPYTSNSDLSKLVPRPYSFNIQAAFSFGTLVHAAILQPHRINIIKNTLDGKPVEPTAMVRALAMKAAFMLDQYCAGFLKSCSVEVEMYNANTDFEHQGRKFRIDTKRKYDMFNHVAGYGGDIKTTAAITPEEFRASVESFEYHRSRVFYAKGSGATRDIIIGISKVNCEIFKVFMQKGDRLWKAGEDRANELAWLWFNEHPPF
jgi:hypothetical protein